MSDQVKRPLRPCGSCPYRKDVPSGVWSEDEYAKLPEYDKPTHEQPRAAFMCHQQDSRLCAGWAAVHDMDENMGLRLLSLVEQITLEELEATRDFTTTVPLFDSGAEAAEHGLREVRRPSDRARKTIAKLERRIGA